MRYSKESTSWNTALVFVVAVVLGAGFFAYREFKAYSWDLSYQSEKSSLPIDTEVSKRMAAVCQDKQYTNKIVCFDEYQRSYRAEIRSQNDLIAQQDMAVWAFGVFLVTTLGLFFSAGGVAALVWTFRETRKMTQAQDRAYLRIEQGHLQHDPTYGLSYSLQIHNSGNTPATFIEARLILTIVSPASNDPSKACEQTYNLECELYELAAKATDYLRSGRVEAILVLPEGLLVSHGSHYRKTGTVIETDDPSETGVIARVTVEGLVTYFDVFGGEHKLSVSQFSMSLEDDQWTLRQQTSPFY